MLGSKLEILNSIRRNENVIDNSDIYSYLVLWCTRIKGERIKLKKKILNPTKQVDRRSLTGFRVSVSNFSSPFFFFFVKQNRKFVLDEVLMNFIAFGNLKEAFSVVAKFDFRRRFYARHNRIDSAIFPLSPLLREKKRLILNCSFPPPPFSSLFW